MNNYYRVLLMVSTAATICAMSNAQEADNPFTLSASAGYEFDSNLTIDAIDSNNNVGDQAIVFDAAAGIEIIDSDEMGLSAGYDFYISKHDEFDNFDMSIHGFNIDSRYTVRGADLGLTIMYNTIGLGGDSFMDLTTIRPNVGYLMPSNKIYLLGAYEYQKHTFKQNALVARDASRNSVSAKAIFILGGGKTATAGYEWTDHNTQDPGYSYTGSTFDFSAKLPIQMFDRETTVRAGYKYQSRGYQMASRRYNDGVIRDDNRHTLSTSWQVPIANGFFGEVDFEYISSSSNYEPVDYDETITTFKIGWEF